MAVVSVSSAGEFTTDMDLDPGFPVSDFESGDFDGNSYADVFVTGYDDESQSYRNSVFFQDAQGWSAGESFELGESGVAVVGDMTGNGIVDLLSVSLPTRVIDLHDDLDVDLVEASWPVALHDLNGDGPSDLIYRPYGAGSNEASRLKLLLSVQ